MPLSREFKALVVVRAKEDPDFRRGLIIEAINMILDGEITAGRIMLRDYINATGSMDEICRKRIKHKSAIAPMLGPSGNPTLESIVPVIKACARREKMSLSICTDQCAA
jgi:DNA-binding phage protein